MKIRTTQRLFYKKFPFKVRLKPEWSICARMSTEHILRAHECKFGRTHRLAADHTKNILDLKGFLDQYSKDDIRLRIENNLTVFFKDNKFLMDLEAQFSGIVDELWQPANEDVLEHMLSEVRVEVKETLTHGCRYKVFLRGRTNNITEENRKGFIKLYQRHEDQFVVPRSTQMDLERPSYSFYGSPYFYVKDSKYLLMAQMLIQPLIRETVKIVTIDELNQKETEHAE